MMKSLIFCIFFCISSSQGLSVSFGAANISRGTWNPIPELACTRYEFVYQRGTYFSLYLKFLGKYSEVKITEIEAFVKKQAGTILFRQQIPKLTLESMVDLNLDYDKITIDVQLSTKLSCETVRVVEGTEVSTLTGDKNVMITKYNSICLKGKRCMLFMNLTDLCTVSDEKLKPQPCNVDRDLHTQASAPTDEDLEVRETLMAAWNFLGFITQNNSSTSSAKSNLKEPGADNTYFTIMIVALVTAAVSTVLLLVVIIRQRCWVNCNSRVICLPQFSPMNENRFYENVVFRPKSQPEVEQREPHIYAEPSVDNSYQEINHRAQLK